MIRVAALLVLVTLGGVLTAQERVPVLLVTGQNNHDCAFTSKTIEAFLEGTGRFEVTLTERPGEFMARPGALARFRAFFLDYNGERWGEAAEKAFLAAVKGGAGVVVMHAANNAFPGWVEYERMVGHLWREGTGHGSFHEFDVAVADRNHPITCGLPAMKDHPDELYHRLVHMHEARYRLLMRAFSSKESGGTGRWEPMATVLEYGAGRVFHTPLGHVWRNVESSRRSILDLQLQLLLARGTEWAATGRVTIAPEAFGLKLPRPATRPTNPWVLRARLDDREDVLVAALDEHMLVAWDLRRGGLWKAWAGTIRESEAASDAEPALLSGGRPWALVRRPSWALRRDGAQLSLAARFLDHEIREVAGRPSLFLRWELAIPGSERRLRVEEWPEHGGVELTTLSRTFTVAGLAEGETLLVNAEGGLYGPLGRGACSYADSEGATRSGKLGAAALELGEGVTTVDVAFEPSGEIDGVSESGRR